MSIVGGHWTYSGNPAASDKDAVRHLLGDTDERDQQLSDEEIEWEVAQAGTVRSAAANAARSLAGRYSLQPSSKKVGDLAVTYGERAAMMLTLAKSLDADANLGAIPRAGGISIADKEAVEADTDRVRPAFSRGMHDHPGVGWPDTDTDTRGYG